MSIIQCSMEDIANDIAVDSFDRQIVVGSLVGPVQAELQGKSKNIVYCMNYAIMSERRGFFIGTMEFVREGIDDFNVTCIGFRDKFIRYFKRKNFRTVDTLSELQFVHSCEDLWPNMHTRALRKNAENKRKKAERKVPKSRSKPKRRN